MKITNFTVIFLLVFMGLFAAFRMRLERVEESIQDKVRVNGAFDRAADASLDGIVQVADGDELEVSYQDCETNFFNTLYAGLGVTDSQSGKQQVQLCTPVLAIAEQDGLTVNYQDTENGELVRRWSQKFRYLKKYSVPIGNSPNSTVQCTVVYTMTNEVTLVCGNLRVTGNWAELKKKYVNGDLAAVFAAYPFESEEMFQHYRNLTISEILIDKINYYVNRHNVIASRYGESYVFRLPEDVRSEIARGVEDISILSFFQGYPLGKGGRYYINRYEVSGARLAKNKDYYVTHLNGVWWYHKASCTQPSDELGVYRFTSKTACAEAGAYPCPYCRP